MLIIAGCMIFITFLITLFLASRSFCQRVFGWNPTPVRRLPGGVSDPPGAAGRSSTAHPSAPASDTQQNDSNSDEQQRARNRRARARLRAEAAAGAGGGDSSDSESIRSTQSAHAPGAQHTSAPTPTAHALQRSTSVGAAEMPSAAAAAGCQRPRSASHAAAAPQQATPGECLATSQMENEKIDGTSRASPVP